MPASKRVNRRCLSRFGEFIREAALKPDEVADVAGISRQHLLRLRFGRCEPTRPVMVWLMIACWRMLGGNRPLRITELFDLGDGEQ